MLSYIPIRRDQISEYDLDLDVDIVYPAMGPHPLRDKLVMGVVIRILIKYLDPGNYWVDFINKYGGVGAVY